MSTVVDLNLSALGEAALAYARRGWHVFPLAASSKVPLRGSRGYKDATLDEVRIRMWWRNIPNANIGIACGPSGLVVLDIDSHKGGFESLAAWEKEGKLLPATRTTRTPNGGEHRYFLANPAAPTKSCSGLRPGIDIRGVDGYVVAPPSVIGGKHYE